MSNTDKVEWVRVEDVCQAFDVHNTTVYTHIRNGVIPAYRLGNTVRIPKRWLDGELARFREGKSVGEQSQTELIEEGRRIARALAAAERAGAL